QQEGGPEMRLSETSGRALVTFAPGGEMTQRFEDFSVTIDSDIEGMTMRMTMNMTGANDARYTVTGNELAFQSDNGAGENTMHVSTSIEMAGRTMPAQEMDSSLFEAHEGDDGATVTYECSGDELLLDIAADAEGQIFFNDARYTRVG
ncbi:MAG TPA: hypothetical protein VK610_08370, partial [Rhodothermales bacterium]|nr:hypothetical protein [Rhodothermales bacterium]